MVARAKAALEGVTEGPWIWDGDSFDDVHPNVCPHDNPYTDHGPHIDGVLDSEGYDGSWAHISTADAEFIAAARDLVPELVAEVERLRAEVQP